MMADIQNKEKEYQNSFMQFSDRIERKLRIGIVVCLLLLLVIQTAMRYPELRYLLSIVDRLEGMPLFVV